MAIIYIYIYIKPEEPKVLKPPKKTKRKRLELQPKVKSGLGFRVFMGFPTTLYTTPL